MTRIVVVIVGDVVACARDYASGFGVLLRNLPCVLDGRLQVRVGHATQVGGGGFAYPCDGILQLLFLFVEGADGVNLALPKGTLGQAAALPPMLLDRVSFFLSRGE